MPLITSYFSVATPDEAAEQATRGFEQIRHATQLENARKASDDLAKIDRQRQNATERQQRRRLRLKQSEVKFGLRDPATLQKIKPLQPRSPAADSPTASSTDQGTLPPPVKRRAARTNWYSPAFWPHINGSTKRVGFSARGIVREVKLGPSGELFKSLNCGTVGHWINSDGTGWTDDVLKRVARAAEGQAPRVVDAEKRLGRPARVPPTVVECIVRLLSMMRVAGTLITRAVAQSVVLAYIRTQAPELFDDPTFKCSESFIRRLLRDKLNWSYRATTQASQKLPANWVQLCSDFAQRLVWNIAMHSVPPELIINADQTGVSYLGVGSRTWELKGSSQVSAVGQSEKRQFTLMVAVAASGDVLPFQAIYKGKTESSLPSEAARKPCEAAGFLFTPGGDRYWSTLDTMKVWIEKCVVPYAEKKRQELGLPLEQKTILILDCWAVHRGKPFLTWMKIGKKSIILLFVPGNCTSVAQPCDTRINRVLKHLIKSACVEHLSKETQRQIADGTEPSRVKIDTSLNKLRNQSTTWLLNAWEWLRDHPEVVRSSWRDTAFGDWDLSYETLTSARSRTVVHERFTEDQSFALAISAQLPDDPNFEEADSPDYDDDTAIDPSILCDIRGRLPKNVIEREGGLDYTGDEN
ncbi:DDE superfamily endonuclease [Ceratobasidium sp. AG-Ba]|nr:DDE superfamily endonuclease [Ceratobasidium sp. AG-Ba]